MGKQHNKKRNVGLIYEQLLNCLSKAIVDRNTDEANTIKEVIKKNFKPGSQLYKEFRLFNALVKTHVPSESLATRIISEAKEASKNFDARELETEKSNLIKDINYKLNNPRFYSQRVDEYREYATIQTLLNGWRSEDSDIAVIAEYETKVHQSLLTEKNMPEEILDPEVDKLTVKLMLEKFNKKYGSVLNDEQVDIIKSYVFDDSEDVVAALREVKKDSLRELGVYKNKCSNNTLLEKIDVVIKNVESLNESSVDDQNISKFLLVSKLKDEMLEKENE